GPRSPSVCTLDMYTGPCASTRRDYGVLAYMSLPQLRSTPLCAVSTWALTTVVQRGLLTRAWKRFHELRPRSTRSPEPPAYRGRPLPGSSAATSGSARKRAAPLKARPHDSGTSPTARPGVSPPGAANRSALSCPNQARG